MLILVKKRNRVKVTPRFTPYWVSYWPLNKAFEKHRLVYISRGFMFSSYRKILFLY